MNVFLFHRDLRLWDHRPLQSCLQHKLPVLPLFILDPVQVSKNEATVLSTKSLSCLFQSLHDLDNELYERFDSHLEVQYGTPTKVLHDIYRHQPFSALYETKDYTPFAIQRQNTIKTWCEAHGVAYHCMDDLYLFTPGHVLNKSGRVFQKFTPFYNTVRVMTIPKPIGIVKGTFHKTTSPNLSRIYRKITGKKSNWRDERRLFQGGRKEGLSLLKGLGKNYKDTGLFKSGLSVHHHYGTISVRESYHRSLELGNKLEEFRRQLFWREFYGHLMAAFKQLYGVDPLQYQLPKPLAGKKKKLYDQWCTSTTGLEVIDAGMRQLKEEGFMPNRLRLLTSSWLIKDAKINWRHGERYFANHLLDYDFSQNMLNWLWVAGGLPFAMAPYRRFNPTLPTSKENDAYVAKWAMRP